MRSIGFASQSGPTRSLESDGARPRVILGRVAWSGASAQAGVSLRSLGACVTLKGRAHERAKFRSRGSAYGALAFGTCCSSSGRRLRGSRRFRGASEIL